MSSGLLGGATQRAAMIVWNVPENPMSRSLGATANLYWSVNMPMMLNIKKSMPVPPKIVWVDSFPRWLKFIMVRKRVPNEAHTTNQAMSKA